MKIPQIHFPKELSWLVFNERVLQEAADTRNPIIERVRFLGIYSNNQDEFFKVRVAALRRESIRERNLQGTQEARKLMIDVQRKVRSMSEEFDRIYRDIERELTKKKVYLLAEGDLSEKQSAWLKDHFRNKILRHIVPILIGGNRRLEHVLEADISYLIVQIQAGATINYAVIDVPARVPRFINVPPDRGQSRNYFMMVDEVMRHCLDEVFGGFFTYDSLAAWSMKFSRDSEYVLSNDLEHSLMKKLSDSMKQRHRAEPMRLSYDRNMPQPMVEMLLEQLGFEDLDSVIPGGRYRNFKDFMSFPNPIGPRLENPRMPAMKNRRFGTHRNLFEAIDLRDIMLYYPYHRFSHFTEFVRQSAFDPAVTAIHINIYRVASNSRVAESLIDAARNGKQVFVNVELRARFDEQHNLAITEKFVDAGIRVTFGIPTLKVHSKLCVVTRVVAGHERHYSLISTGNFNERTAKVYTDFALFTSNQDIGREALEVFTFIDYSYRQPHLKHLLVSPINTRDGLMRLIQRETEHVNNGRQGLIRAKINNLADDGIAAALCEASQAGVKIQLLVRGMCSLKPGIPGFSENIEITSIVDRHLEHARVLYFHNDGNSDLYIASADWMTRNIDERVEVTCPIYDPVIKAQILDILDMQFNDNYKARVVDADQTNAYVQRGSRPRLRSQEKIYEYLEALERKTE